MNKFHLSQFGYFVACCSIITLGVAVLWYSYLDISTQVQKETTEALELQATLKASMVEGTFNESIRDIGFIYSIPSIAGLVRAANNEQLDPLDNTPYQLWVERLENIFHAYIENNNNIVQVRLIGIANRGREIVRVHSKNGQIEIVQGENLQQKSNREYFKKARELDKGQIYVSEITLNREFGKIEEPAWPTYRAAQAVFDDNGQLFGIVIINFNAQIMLDKFVDHLGGNIDSVLLNEKGQYLVDFQDNKAFAFEYGKDVTWYNDTLYSEVNDNKKNQFNVFVKNIPEQRHSYMPPLSIVTTQDPETVNDTVMQRYTRVVMIVSGLILLALLLLTLYRLFCNASLLKHKAQAEVEAIFRDSKDIILSMDAVGKIESWNQTALNFFGLKAIEMRKAHIDQLFQGTAALQIIKQQSDAIFANEKVVRQELEIQASDGQDTVMSVIFSPVKVARSAVSSVSAIFRDVTEDSLLRESLQISNKQLALKNKEMEAFIYTVSHDLKSPLVTIGGFSDRILKTAGDGLDEKNRHRLTRIRDNVDDMATLLSSLLNLARVVKQDLDLEFIEIGICIEKAQQHLGKSIEDSSVVFQVENPEQEVMVNSTLLVQCLQNLFSNAINYAAPERPLVIKINVYTEEKFVCIDVSDNGIGIAEKHQEKIFKIFERLEVGSGTGVGLAIVKTIMEKHHGHVRLASTVNVGSTFTLCIPKAKPKEDRNEST